MPLVLMDVEVTAMPLVDFWREHLGGGEKSGLSNFDVPYMARLIASRVVTGSPDGWTMKATPLVRSQRRMSERLLRPDNFRKWGRSAITSSTSTC